MNNLIPYISSEPPPILNDSFQHESFNRIDDRFANFSSAFAVELKSRDFLTTQSIDNDSPMEIDSPHESNQSELIQYHNYGRNNDLQSIRSPIELSEFIDSVVEVNNLSVDVPDGPVTRDDDLDRQSAASIEGEFDEFIDCDEMTEENRLKGHKMHEEIEDEWKKCEIDQKGEDFIGHYEENRLNRDNLIQEINEEKKDQWKEWKIDDFNEDNRFKREEIDREMKNQWKECENDREIGENRLKQGKISEGIDGEMKDKWSNDENSFYSSDWNEENRLKQDKISQEINAEKRDQWKKCEIDKKLDDSCDNIEENHLKQNEINQKIDEEIKDQWKNDENNYYSSDREEENRIQREKIDGTKKYQSEECEIDQNIEDFNEENRLKQDELSEEIYGEREKCENSEILQSNFADFGEFAPVIDNREQLDDFADFSGVADCVENGEEFDDDFEDFATFEQPQQFGRETVEVTRPSSHIGGIECALKSLIEKFNSVESNSTKISDSMDLSFMIRGDSFISNQRIFDEMGYTVWKELINYDYSPAFIFQWMQSATYEKFMSSLGTEYREMLSSHRATLPLYSVNLTPIEPVPIDNFSQINVSASSSIIDLTSKDETGTVPSDKGSMNIDFKNLEEEFVFNHVSSTPEIKYPDELNSPECPPSLTNNISSTVVQSDRFGGILKSFLKPLNPTKTGSNNKPMNPQTEAILKELPDLSYMSSKVLMFPVISNCDVEDNI